MREHSETGMEHGADTDCAGRRHGARRAVTVAVATVLVASLVVAGAPAAAASQELVASDEPSFVVQVHENGSATVTLTLTYDLTTKNETEAFRSLQSNEEAQADLKQRFLTRMQNVAAAAENATGRDMRVHSASVSLSTANDGNRGVVKLTVAWDGLAATRDGALVVTEPFASGYVTNRAFVIRAPDGYTLASVTPTPAEQSATAAMWTADTDLSGFKATFSETKPTTTTTTTTADAGDTGGGVSGFGVGIALAALVGAALLGIRQRQ